MRVALREAMLARDRAAVDAIRSALSAIDNAGAVPAPDLGLAIEEAAIGAGSADVARRELDDGDAEAIVQAEISELEAAASRYEELGETDRAGRLRSGARALRALLG
nr:MAG: hypothetical protein DIU67_02725 [Actinomycetota bacterium]